MALALAESEREDTAEAEAESEEEETAEPVTDQLKEKAAKAKVYCPLMLNRMEPVEVSASQRPPEVPSGTLTDPVEDLA